MKSVREIGNKKLYTVGDIAKVIKRSNQTINKWFKYSELVRTDKIDKAYPGQSLMPPCTRINGIKYWSEDDIPKIKEFKKIIKKTSYAKYNRENSWGQRGAKIKENIKKKKEKEREELERIRSLPQKEQEKIRWKKWQEKLKKEDRKKLKKKKQKEKSKSI